MKIPFSGNVSARLVQKRFEGQIFYYVFDQQANKGYKIGYGFLRVSDIEFPAIRYFNKDNNLSPCAQHCKWDMIFSDYDDAKKKLKDVESLYRDRFAKRPFMKLDMLNKIKPQLLEIEAVINLIFDGDDDFNGVMFSDVSARGIQVYAGGHHTTINYDLGNKVSVIGYFINAKINEASSNDKG